MAPGNCFREYEQKKKKKNAYWGKRLKRINQYFKAVDSSFDSPNHLDKRKDEIRETFFKGLKWMCILFEFVSYLKIVVFWNVPTDFILELV